MRHPSGGFTRPAGALALACVIGWPLPAPAPLSVDALEEDEQEDMVVRLELEGHVLTESEYMRQQDGEIFYPLGQMARHLELAIEVDAMEGRVSGWVLDPDESVSFETATGEGRVGNDAFELDADAWIEEHDDLYIREDALQHFLPVEFEYRPRRAEVRGRALDELPLLSRLEREARWASLTGGTPGARGKRRLPLAENPRRWIARPAWSLSLDQSVSDQRSSSRASLAAAGDFLLHEADWRAQADEEGVRRVDGTLGQEVGHAALQRYELGRVSAPGYDLLRGGRSGAGASVTNRPDGAARTTFTDQIIEGEAPEDWAVELYRDEDLIDFIDPAARDGERYEFDDIDARPGTNHYTVKLYGPHGEREEISRRIEIGPGLLPPGTVHYSLDAVRPRQSLYQRDERRESVRAGARMDVGLTRTWSVGSDFHWFEGGEEDEPSRELAGVDTTVSALGFWTRLRGAFENDEHRAWQFATTRGVGAWNLSYEVLHNDGLDSDDLRGSLAERHELEASGPVGGLFRTRLRLEQERDTDGDRRRRLRTRENVRVADLTLRHALRISEDQDGDVTASGSLSTRWGRSREGRFNLSSSYDLHPQSSLNTVSLSHSRDLGADWRGDGGVAASLNDRPHRFHLGLSRGAHDYWRLTGRADIDTDGGWSVRAGVDVGALPHPDGGWQMDPAAGRGYNRGSALGRVELDGQPQEGVRVCADRSCTETDEEGEAWLSRLDTHEPVDLHVETASIDDPFVQPSDEGRSYVLRPGNAVAFEQDLHVTGEVDGHVHCRRNDGGRTGVSGFAMEAVDLDTGEVVATERSAYDGLYILDRLPPGEYRVQATREQAERLEVPQSALAQKVNLGEGGELVRGQGLTVDDQGRWVTARNPVEPVDGVEFEYDGEHPLKEHLAYLLEIVDAADLSEARRASLLEEVRMLNGEIESGDTVYVPADQSPLDRISHWELSGTLPLDGDGMEGGRCR